ncbi:SDR family NAD(P)-dependent oxidoreductase [Epilithonimonas hungarica]|uniref:3-oxoacyl-[acyl-carrier protein] reductase n=1 Tax=Epilithonimonas hungarica TaxID=454006 RepID=A0A1G7SQQ6_9FLAO|nr:glucose 1-dehydrogenase [Epilithonimonas hungarica]SDG25427.1 3-oxoacyl-[acyl-carrier protein] reductase [Epilithonimonas hungarica]
MKKLEGKVAIVTGASKGIGAGIARAFAEEGASVVVNYASDKAGAENMVNEIIAKDGKAIAIYADVSKEADVKKMFEEANTVFGRLDILVNNAGVFKSIPIEEISVEEFNRHYSINVLGNLLATREAVKYFGEKGGSIINMTSVVSEKGVPTYSIYSGTKGAVQSITHALAAELGPKNIRVNAIAPGAIETEGTQVDFGGGVAEQYIKATPLRRMGFPKDVAKVAVFLASDDSAFLADSRIEVSGGLK